MILHKENQLLKVFLSNSVNATPNNGKVPTRSINQVSNERILSSPVMPMYDKVKAISIPDRHKNDF